MGRDLACLLQVAHRPLDPQSHGRVPAGELLVRRVVVVAGRGHERDEELDQPGLVGVGADPVDEGVRLHARGAGWTRDRVATVADLG